MRVLIHALAMRKQGGGSRHLEGLVQALGLLDRENQYVLCLNRHFPFTSSYPNINVYPVEIKSLFHRLWWDQVILPRMVLKEKIDVAVALFVFGMFRPSVPQITFQRNPQFYCWAYLKKLRGRSLLEISLRRKMAYWTMRASRAIVTPSCAMQEMIRAFHPDLPLERFHVLPHGFEREQLDRESAPNQVAEKLARCQGKPLILYVSHLEPHKGHDAAISAMRFLKSRGVNCCLAITIDRTDWPCGYDRLMGQIQNWELDDAVINLGRVPEGAVHVLYQEAKIFFFPSLCESFGFPLVEAMGYGLPIVAADTALNREMCGPAAMYYSPSDPLSAANHLAALLSLPEKREELRKLSQRQFYRSHLSWTEYAKRFINLLREAISDGSG
ncbi:MAG: glycosyltransferase family 1 protein [Candidatus Methanomethyliaceae archaeon]